MGRPPASEGRDTRRAILDASLNLFAESGFFGTSMREIAREVGVRESAIYHHFPSKEALFEALMREVGDAKVQQFEAELSKMVDAPARQLLSRLGQAMLESWGTPRELKVWRIMATEGLRLSEQGKIPVDIGFRAVRGRLERLFEELVASGRIRPVVSQLASMEFVAPMLLIRNMLLIPKAFALPQGVTPSDVMQSHIDFFCDAVGAPKD
jgi:AcrR family transcriptional regulator